MTMSIKLHSTINGKPTLNHVYELYKLDLGKNDHISRSWNEQTRKDYERYLTGTLFPLLNDLPLDEYTEEDIETILASLLYKEEENGKRARHYDIKTVNRFRMLIRIMYELAIDKKCCFFNPLWGSPSSLPEVSMEERMLRTNLQTPKSLTAEIELLLNDLFFREINQSGEMMGLLLMFCLGLRNSESCAVNFGDIKCFDPDTNSYAIYVYKTTTKNFSKLKAGGKTSNANRILPLTNKLRDFLLSRKAYILNQLTSNKSFSEDDAILLIDDVPVVCIDRNYKERSDANRLTSSGKIALRNAKLQEETLSVIGDHLMSNDNLGNDEINEKDPTTYLFRRNAATHFENLGMSQPEIEYLLGHNISDPYITRNDFAERQKLLTIKEKLELHPIFSDNNLNLAYPSMIPEHVSSIYRSNASNEITLNQFLPGEVYLLELVASEPGAPINTYFLATINESLIPVQIISDSTLGTTGPADIIRIMYAEYDRAERKLISSGLLHHVRKGRD